MFSQARALLEQFAYDYAMRDIERAMAHCHEDVTFAMHVPRDMAPFAGVTVGRALATERVTMIADALELFRWDIVTMRPSVGAARVHIHYHWRHRATGEDLEGFSRQVWTVRDGLLGSCDDFHDAGRVAAFFRLVAILPPLHTAALAAGAPPPPREPDAIVKRMRASAILS